MFASTGRLQLMKGNADCKSEVALNQAVSGKLLRGP
jgi:hypothetical protein